MATVSPFPNRTAAADTAPPSKTDRAPSLAGSLDQMPLPDLLQTAGSNGRTGRIDLQHGSDDAGPTGRIWMLDGRIVDAALQGDADGEPLAGRDALYRLLSWTEGRFALLPVDVDMPDRIQDSTSYLLLDAMRQIDEERRSESPGHAVLPDEPPEPSRAEQAEHLALLLLNVTSTWVGARLRPQLIARRLDEVRDVLRQGNPLLDRFELSDESGLVGRSAGLEDLAEPEIEQLVKSVGLWLRGFYRRMERSLPGKFSLERLAELTGAHGDQLTELGFHVALGWPDRWPEDDATTLAVTPDPPADAS